VLPFPPIPLLLKNSRKRKKKTLLLIFKIEEVNDYPLN
jgi:hypothetical protein